MKSLGNQESVKRAGKHPVFMEAPSSQGVAENLGGHQATRMTASSLAIIGPIVQGIALLPGWYRAAKRTLRGQEKAESYKGAGYTGVHK